MLNINKWGPSGWNFLQSIAFKYPKNPTLTDMALYRDFYMSAGKVLPCDLCKEHYRRNIKIHPINLRSNKTLTMWINRLHNHVNEAKGKPIYSYYRMVAEYDPEGRLVDLTDEEWKEVQFYRKEKCCQHKLYIFIIILIIVAVSFIVYLATKKRMELYRDRS